MGCKIESDLDRLSPTEAIKAYFKGPRVEALASYEQELHKAEMLHIAPGLIGALLRLRLASLSGPEIGSQIPFLATHIPGDILRLFVDPEITAYGPVVPTGLPHIKKAHRHVVLSALTYAGDVEIHLSTKTLPPSLTAAVRFRLAAELQYQAKVLSARR